MSNSITMPKLKEVTKGVYRTDYMSFQALFDNGDVDAENFGLYGNNYHVVFVSDYAIIAGNRVPLNVPKLPETFLEHFIHQSSITRNCTPWNRYAIEREKLFTRMGEWLNNYDS